MMKEFKSSSKSYKTQKKSIITNDKKEKFDLYKRALNLQKQGDFIQASNIYKDLIKNKFQNQEVFLNYAAVCQYMNKPNDAILLLKEAIKINPNNSIPFFKMGFILNNNGRFYESLPFAKKAIELNPNLWQGYHNLIKILINLNRPKEAKLEAINAKRLFSKNHLFDSLLGDIHSSTGDFNEAIRYYKNAISISPNDEVTLYTFANFSVGIGNKKESVKFFNKVLKINPLHSLSFYSLSTIIDIEKDEIIKNKIIKLNLLEFKSNYDRYTILFSKSHISHKLKDFEKSSKFLKEANDLKLKVRPSNIKYLIQFSESIKNETSNDRSFDFSKFKNLRDIFIVGLPRSGSTLVESIIGMNKDVFNLGENSIFYNAFIESKKSNFREMDAKYFKYAKYFSSKKFTTNKTLSNYMHIPYLLTKLEHSKIIYTFRNPLDNLLSMYRAKFNGSGNEYSSSLIDSANYYIYQFNLMSFYSKKYRENIYFLSYDKLVYDPETEIKKLITWLGFNWDDYYLYPYKSKQGFFTASNVQVRSPINNKSVGSWGKYSKMMSAPLNIFTQNNFSLDSFENLID